jgi:hypothetical protein
MPMSSSFGVRDHAPSPAHERDDAPEIQPGDLQFTQANGQPAFFRRLEHFPAIRGNDRWIMLEFADFWAVRCMIAAQAEGPYSQISDMSPVYVIAVAYGQVTFRCPDGCQSQFCRVRGNPFRRTETTWNHVYMSIAYEDWFKACEWLGFFEQSRMNLLLSEG